MRIAIFGGWRRLQNPTLSLARAARAHVTKLTRKNRTLQGARRSVPVQLAVWLVSSMRWWVVGIGYAGLLGLFWLGESILRGGKELSEFAELIAIPGATMAGWNDVFLTVQAQLLGIVFPIALALVALVLQQRGQSFTSPRVRIFYRESLAFEVGRSSVLLIVALILYRFLPVEVSAPVRSPDHYPLAATLASFIHGAWLTLNTLCLWHFVATSLLFVGPDGQQRVLRRWSAEMAIGKDIFERVAANLALQPHVMNLFPHDLSVSKELDTSTLVSFGGLDPTYDRGASIEVRRKWSGRRSVIDIRYALIVWVATRWRRDLDKMSLSDGSTGIKPQLEFSPEFGRSYEDGCILCKQSGGRSLTHLEKLAVRFAFSFKSV